MRNRSNSKNLVIISVLFGFLALLAFWQGGALVSSFTPTSTLTATPTIPSPTPTLPDEIFKGTISQPTFCHVGPNESYIKAIPLAAGIRVDILAVNSDGGDWFMVRGLGIDPCWVEARMLNPEPNVDFQRVMILTTIITTENTPCREFPSPDRAIQTIIPKDRRIVSYGKNDSEAKWILVVPHNSTNLCWIENKFSIDFESLPIESADFALAPTPTATKQLVVITIATTKVHPSNTPGGPSNTPVPPATNTPVPPPTNAPSPTPTPTLCWPPGYCIEEPITVTPTFSSQTATPSLNALAVVGTEAKQQFADAFESNIAFVYPQTMDLGNTVVFELRLSPLLTEPQLAATVIDNRKLTPMGVGTDIFIDPEGNRVVVESASNIESTKFMKAELKSQNPDAFVVERLHSDDVQVSTNGIWQWSITAREKGINYLSLNIYMLYKVDGKDTWPQVKSYEKSIEVTVEPLDQISSFDWKWIIGILIPALFIPIFFRWYDKKRRKPTSQKPITKRKRKPKSEK